jgi:hypothetical protein
MLNRTHVLSAVCLSVAAGLCAAPLRADDVTITKQTVAVSPGSGSLPAGVTAKNLNDDKSIDKAFKALAEDAVSKDGFDNVVGTLVDQDRDRIKKSFASGSLTNIDNSKNTKLNDIADRLGNGFRDKYHQKFDIDVSKAFLADFLHIRTGEVSDPALLVGKWPVDASPTASPGGKLSPADAQQAKDKAFGGDVNLDKGRNIAVAHIPAIHGLPAISASLIHENLAGWKFDVPNTLNAQKLYDNLVANLTFVDQHRNDWPADMYEADRHITHAVVAALYDIDLSKTGDTAKLPSHTLDGGAPRPADGGMANENK